MHQNLSTYYDFWLRRWYKIFLNAYNIVLQFQIHKKKNKTKTKQKLKIIEQTFQFFYQLHKAVVAGKKQLTFMSSFA